MKDNSRIAILFVCMGNICRSPAGENVLRKFTKDAGIEVEIDSAGTIGYHSGSKPDRRMSVTASKRGYDFTGSARQVSSGDLQDFDFIIAMDNENYSYLISLSEECFGGKYNTKIRKFIDFCNDDSYKKLGHVPDPYYGGQSGFEKVLDLVEDGCAGIINEIKNNE